MPYRLATPQSEGCVLLWATLGVGGGVPTYKTHRKRERKWFYLAEAVGFEPTHDVQSPGGFQDHSLKPLGYASVWWALGDLNPGPSGYEPDALTN